jgi:hypothetical protein
MSLTEKTIVDKIEVLENCIIQVRQANVVERDGKEIARTFHRYVLLPGADLAGQEPKIIAIANALWTQEVIDAYINSLPKLPNGEV